MRALIQCRRYSWQSPFVFLPQILRPCGQPSHGYMVKCGVFGCCFNVGNWLQRMYVKFGDSHSTYKVFDEMPLRSVHSLCLVIRSCSELKDIRKGNFVYAYVKENGFDKHVTVMNSLISMYSRMGRLDLAQHVFDNVIFKDIVSWNSLITGYAQNHNCQKVFELFSCLRGAENLVPNVVTFLALLRIVGHASTGMSIHGHLISFGLYSDVQLGTAIFNIYANCGRLDYAEIVFKEDLTSKTLVSWNSLIAAYKREGYWREAAHVYEQMGAEPDSFSFANVLPVYGSLGDIGRVKLIHAMIIKRGLSIEKDVVLSTALLDAYGKCSDVRAAEFLFSRTNRQITATWNALIAVYIINDQIEDGVNLCHQMVRSSKVSLDSITIVTFCQLCGQIGSSLKHANMLHGFTVIKGFSSHLTVGNALIDMYMKCGYTQSAELVFHSMLVKNTVTWNIMLYGVECHSTALGLFQQMLQSEEYKPDSVTIISLLQGSLLATSSSCHLELIHAYILKYGLASETKIMNGLIDAFAKMGNVERARQVFMQTDFKRDESSWNIMIAGYGMNGQGTEACKLFSEMDVNPDAITFTSLLSSCSHCGLVEDGCKLFELMITKYKIQPTTKHWTCIIDMLGRANSLEDAYDVITQFQSSSSGGGDNVGAAVWGALLSACRVNMNMEVGQVVGKKLWGNFNYYSLLSNLYSSNKKWNEATIYRKVFGQVMMKKPRPGLSSLKG